MNNTVTRFLSALFVAVALAGCEQNPIGKLIDPTVSNTTGASSGHWAIFSDELRTGGATMFLTTSEGQVLDFNCTENPVSGAKCMKYSWDGSAVTEYSSGNRQSDYVGFMLIAAPTLAGHDTITRDLSAGGYTKVSFYVRGSLNTHVVLRIEANNATYQTASGTNAWMSNTADRVVTSDWKRYEFALSGSQAAVRDFIRIVLRYDEDGNPDTPNSAHSNGGTVFLDNIEYTR